MVAVDNVDALRSWLVKKLTPICDADPQALAKYVVALLKKDKSDSVLKVLCKEQLDVFLQKESEVFVNELFDALQSKCYLNPTQLIDSKFEARNTSQDQKRRFKESRRLQPGSGRSPARRPRTPESRRHDDRRHRRSPLGQRRHYNRRARSRTPSPRRRSRFSNSPTSRKRNQRSPRRSRSPLKRKTSNSNGESPDSKRSSSTESTSDKRVSEKHDGKKKERCWDYNEKGFCIKGDSCPYDHGNDAVVVDDFSTVPEANDKNKTTRPIDHPPPVSMQPPPMLPSHPVMRGLPLGIPFPPPPMPPLPVPPPGMLHRMPMPMMPPMPVPPPSNFPPPGYNPEDPALSKIDSNKTEVHRKRPGGAEDELATEPKPKRTYYNNTTGSYNKTIVVKKIPAILNNITKLNEHFAKFGAINNIQVKFNSKPDEALVEFAHVNNARSAMRSSDPILNNRFIRVFWHKNGESEPAPSNGDNQKSEVSLQYNVSKLDEVKDTEESNSVEKVSQPITTGESNDVSENDSEAVEKRDRNAQLAAEKKAIIEASIAAQKKILAARKAVREKTIERRQQVLQKKFELQKQKQGLVQKQMEQQKLLLAKLNATRDLPASDKAELLSTLKALTNAINSTKSLNVNVSSHNKNSVEKLRSKNSNNAEAESEEPASILSMKRKLNQLKSEAGSLGIVAPSRGGWGRGRGRGGRGRGRGNSHRFIRPGSNLDRRPSGLTITGFVEEEKDDIMSHFLNFGEIETDSFGEDGVSCSIKYKSRHSAEQALSHAVHFKGRNLIISWSSPPKPAATTIAAPKPVPQSSIDYSSLTLSSDDASQDDENTNGANATASVIKQVDADLRQDDDYGYGMLDEELDEEVLLAGGDLDDDDDDDDNDFSERSWRR